MSVYITRYFIHCEIYHKISESVNKEGKVATLEEMVTSISKVFIQYVRTPAAPLIACP
jgi:hypothetical protein